jgi:sulfur carrier protein ThiS
LGRRFELAVEEGTTLAQLIEQVLSIPQEDVALIAVNDRVADQDHVLQAQDRVDLFPPMVGG